MPPSQLNGEQKFSSQQNPPALDELELLLPPDRELSLSLEFEVPTPVELLLEDVEIGSYWQIQSDSVHSLKIKFIYSRFGQSSSEQLSQNRRLLDREDAVELEAGPGPGGHAVHAQTSVSHPHAQSAVAQKVHSFPGPGPGPGPVSGHSKES